jgi:hypothetical protein
MLVRSYLAIKQKPIRQAVTDLMRTCCEDEGVMHRRA